MAAHIGQIDRDPLAGTIYTHHHRWDASSTLKRYLPWKLEFEGTVPTTDDVRHFLGGNYKLLEITCFTTGSNIAGNTTFGLHIDNDSSPVASVLVNMSAKDSPFKWDFRGTDNQVNWGQPVALSCDPLGDPGDFVATSVWERTG